MAIGVPGAAVVDFFFCSNGLCWVGAIRFVAVIGITYPIFSPIYRIRYP